MGHNIGEIRRLWGGGGGGGGGGVEKYIRTQKNNVVNTCLSFKLLAYTTKKFKLSGTPQKVFAMSKASHYTVARVRVAQHMFKMIHYCNP